MKLAEGKLFESGGTRVAACSEDLNLSAFFMSDSAGTGRGRGAGER
jgi:hypothetical protein